MDTLGPQAVDVFYVQEAHAGALSDDRAAEAAHAVRAALGRLTDGVRRAAPDARITALAPPQGVTARPPARHPARIGWTSARSRRTRGPPTCSPRSPTGSPTPSRTFAARAASPRPTSTRPRARSASPCSRPTWRCRSSRSSSPRSRSARPREEVSQALNPAQQIVKIVNDELVEILGGETRRLRFAKTGPTVIMLAGLQGAGKTTLAAKLALWLKEQGRTPLLVAADLQRPNAVNQLQVNGERAGVPVFAPEPGNGVGDPVAVARASVEEAKRKLHDVVIVDTAGRLGVDAELMQQAADIRDAVEPDEVLFVVDAMIGQDAVTTAQAFLDGRRLRRRRADQARRRRPRRRRALDPLGDRPAGDVRLRRREAHRLRPLPPRPDGRRGSSTWATCSP